MPLSKDRNGCGTIADRQTSFKYCSYCYADGKFLQPDMSAEELKEMGGFMKLFSGVFSKGIPKIVRWKKD